MKVFVNGIETDDYTFDNGVITIPLPKIKEGFFWSIIAKVGFLKRFAIDETENITAMYEL